MTKLPLKCYHTETRSGEHQKIVFAFTRAGAIMASEAMEWDGDYINVRATRRPAYDKYAAQGFVPKKVLLEDGWWFECNGRRDDMEYCCKHLTIDEKPYVTNEKVYCDCGCWARSMDHVRNTGHR